MPTPQTTDADPIRLLIADDHEIFRSGLRKLLESEPGFEVVDEASNGAEAVALARQHSPAFLLLDLAMPGMSGLETIRELSSSCACRIVLLTAEIEKRQILEALRLGASGVVLKQSATRLLFKCIRAVMNDEFWVDNQSVADLVQALRQVPPVAAVPVPKSFGLTPRELQIVSTVVAGCPNKEIAQQFSISKDTVKHHLSSIFDKLGVSNRLELALFAISHHLVTD